MMYKDFSEYIKANCEDAEKIIEKMENPSERETLNDTMNWLIYELKKDNDILNLIEIVLKNKLGKAMSDEIMNKVARQASELQIRHSLGDWEFEKMFNENMDNHNDC